jgi:hypothetical protein
VRAGEPAPRRGRRLELELGALTTHRRVAAAVDGGECRAQVAAVVGDGARGSQLAQVQREVGAS